MKRKAIFISAIVLLVAIVVCVTVTSWAWYMQQFEASQSLDFAVFSETLVTMDLNGNDFKTLISPAKAYPGAVASGLPVTDIFANPFYYSTNGSTFVPATSDQLRARLALRYYTPSASAEKDRYPLATLEQLQSADAAVQANIYYFNGLSYTQATSAQIGEGLCIYSSPESTARANKTDLEASSYVEHKAQIGVAELSMAVYGGTGEGNVMTLACQLTSVWPNSPINMEEVLAGDEEDPNSEYWAKDIGDEVSYMVCVAGSLGFMPDDNLLVSELPDTTIKVLDKEQTGYYDFTLGFVGDDMYLFTSNLSHDVLLNYFGVNTYDTIVANVTTTVANGEITAFSVNFNSTWAASNSWVAGEVGEDEGTLHYAMYQAIRSTASTHTATEFQYNNITYAAVETASNTYVIYQVNNGIQQMVTSTSSSGMDLYVFWWYNQVDELISPNVSFGDVMLSITLKLGE